MIAGKDLGKLRKKIHLSVAPSNLTHTITLKGAEIPTEHRGECLLGVAAGTRSRRYKHNRLDNDPHEEAQLKRSQKNVESEKIRRGVSRHIRASAGVVC